MARSVDAASVSAQATSRTSSQQGKQQITVARVTVSPHDSVPRAPAPSKRERGASLKDAQLGKRALQLSPVQERAMEAVRARYSPGIKSIIARLNALTDQQAATGLVKATEDTLRGIIGAEHAALDSLVTPDQRQRFNEAMRRAHAEATPPPPHHSPTNH
ncbi:MAG: hypothetical protein ACR2GG_02030 [Gemmatimonadaceae bacterium]